ncbi:ESPR-type extended signal peptide-containing protein [Burkholderia cepacia]|uniref:ESPR-type extended signal peptide-containing protein n=1 Tax=Burkholderia cepacia TaxID=292 RepID=UPI001CF321FF|nr:ESPR-type extended signal peptide-containing protein [Burkholderia cepacia]MCA8115214.1 YadA-like family protein [Burkholderia cepacia]MCA8401231.1 YadA-like family protein [Burkholderia cepacia]
MNKTYRSVWNAVTNTWTAAAETAKSHSKGSARAARQAVIAIALGGAAIGGAAAAETCTTEDGASGTVDAAGVCKAAGGGAIGMMGTVGTMATDDTTFVKVNATANPANATGANAIAIGQTVTSAGSSSVAIGSNTTASGLHSVALGAGAKNADASDRQIAIGSQAQTTGKYTIAMGYQASATVEDALAFGRASSATSTGAVAIGAAATSGGTGSTAIGQSAAVVSSATNAVALGMNARVANSNSAAIGSNAFASNNYSNALGASASSTGTASLALGSNSTATGNYSVALGSAIGTGRAAVATGNTAVAIGTTASAGANNAVALGYGTVADRDNTVSVGAGVPNIDGNKFTRQIVNVAAGTEDNDAVNVGQMKTALSTKVDDTYVQIDTSNSTVAAKAGTAALAIGTNTSASGSYATAFGNSALASGNNSTALGFQASSAGGAAVAVGNGANASGSHGVALGVNARSTHTDSVALGAGAATDRDNSVSVGSSTLQRQITNVAAGTADTDAVNVAQMNAGLSTTNAAIAATNLNVSSLSTGLSSTSSTVAGLSTGLSSTSSTVAGLSTGLSSTNSTVAGLSTDLSTTNSTVAGLSTGLSSTNSTVAGLSTDLSTTNSTVAGLSTGLSTTNSTVAGLSTGLSSTTSTVTGHTKQIGDLDDKLSKLESGTSGLVQQANPGDDITVGANTDGNAVNFSSNTGARTLKGVAAGDVSATSTEAVNGSQLHGVSDSVASAIGGGSTVNPDGSISAPAFSVGDGSGGTKIVNSVGDVVTNLDSRTTANEGDIKKLADDIGSGTLGLVQQANPGDDITVGANTDGNAVDFSSKTGARTLKGVAAGDVSAASTEAVNGSQLHGVSDSVAKAIGGSSVVNPDGSISAPSFTVGDGSGGTKIVNSVGDVVTNLDGRVTTNEGDIKKLADDIGSGTLGLVQQANPGDDITVGANTDGHAVNFSSKTGARTLKGVAAGDVSATSTEAVNGSQLHGVSDSVAKAIGGSSVVNPDGSISAPAFTVGDGSGGTKIVNSVGDVVANLDGRTTANEGDIKKLADDIGSGTLGLVQQANPGDDITVGANTNGHAVNFSSKTGARTLKGVAAGDVSATSTEAVNGSQLHGVSESVASAIGGGATVTPDGSISAPAFAVGDGSGGTKIVNSVGDVVTNLDGRVTTNEGGLKKLSEQLESGSLGLVQQNPTTGGITVGANTGGTVVNFAGTGGARVLSGVANGVDDDDVVTVSQLRATGLIDYTGKEVGAVTYDSGLNFDTVTFAGTFGTKLQRVAAGEISATSMDAINGSQLFDLQEQFAKQYGELSGQFGDLSHRFDDLSDRLGELETNPGTGGPGTGDGSTVVGEGAVASGENSSALGEKALASGENSSAVGQGAVASGSNGSAIGQGSTASGSNSSAIGQGAVASGNNGSAVGQGSVASGENGTALGQGAVASGKDSTALGQGASASGSGSVAIGQGSVATEANTVSFGNGTEEGNRRLVNIADGINASDAATKGQLDRAMESVDARFNDTNRAINDVAKNAYAGIAAAMAMPNMTPSQPGKTVVAVGAANFKSGSAIAAGATYRSRNGNWLVNGATSITSVGDVGVRAQVGYEF